MKRRLLMKSIQTMAAAVLISVVCIGTACAGMMNPSGFEDDDYPGEHVDIGIEGGLSESPFWSGSSVGWTKYGDVSKYRVTLYRRVGDKYDLNADEKIVMKYVVSQTRIDLSRYLVGSGPFYATVDPETGWGFRQDRGQMPWRTNLRSTMDSLYASQRAKEQANEAAQTKKVQAGTAEDTAEEEEEAKKKAAQEGHWLQAEDGTGRWWYQYGDGSYPVSDWRQIDGNQYYFDEEGWMVTGVQEIEGITYQFDENGVWQKM